MTRKISIAIFIVLLVAGALAGVKTLQIKKLIAYGAALPRRPNPFHPWWRARTNGKVSSGAIGTIAAVQGVTITPEIPGIMREIAFESGAAVAKGDLLVRLDTSAEEAQLGALEAQEGLARPNLARERTLRSQNCLAGGARRRRGAREAE